MGGRPGAAPSSRPGENADTDTGAPSTLTAAPREPQKPKEEGPSQAEKAAEIARLEQAISEDEAKLGTLEQGLKKSDKRLNFDYDATLGSLEKIGVESKLNEALAKPEVKTQLESLGFMTNGQIHSKTREALLKLIVGLKKEAGGLINVAGLFKREFEPYIQEMMTSLKALTANTPKETIFADFNRLTGIEIFYQGKAILNPDRNGFTAYITTRSGEKIREDLAKLKEYYEVKGRLAENNGKALALSSGAEGETSNLEEELKKRKILKRVNFKKSEQAVTHLTDAVSLVSDEDLRRKILDHLEKGIEAVEAGPEDLITIEEDGRITVTKKADLERQAQEAQAQAAEEPSTGIQGFIEQFLGKDSVIGKILIAILSILGLGKAAEASKPASAEQGKQGAAAAPASPSGSPEVAPDEFTKQKDELVAALTTQGIPKATLDVLRKTENKTVLEQIIQKKKSATDIADWEQYLDAYLGDEEIEELKKPDISAQKIQEILTSEEPEEEQEAEGEGEGTEDTEDQDSTEEE